MNEAHTPRMVVTVLRFTEAVILSIILKHISEAVQTNIKIVSLFFNVNGADHDTDNNKLHNEKTPQQTKKVKETIG